jgi:rubrerythrin
MGAMKALATKAKWVSKQQASVSKERWESDHDTTWTCSCDCGTTYWGWDKPLTNCPRCGAFMTITEETRR